MKNIIQSHWGKYLAVILIPIVLWAAIFSVLKKPASNEKLSILFVGSELDSGSLRQTVEQVLPELSDQKLQKITVAQAVPGNMSYFDFMRSQSFRYDIIIMTQSQFRENTGQSLFPALSKALQDAFPHAQLYTESTTDLGELPYGLILRDGLQKNRFSSFYSGNEICYLFFSPDTVNLAGKNGIGSPSDDCALKIAEYLLETVN